jgi:SMC interacting uncharacterized protein involved in chromosome segregation
MSDRRTLRASTAHNRQSVASLGRPSCSVGKRPVRSGKDGRDLHNKAFQKESKQKAIAFLAEQQYPAEISPKTLMNQKEFISVVWFLLGVIQPEIKALPASERSVDTVIHHLKLMEYPFVPPKSTLQSCSSPLFLPAMLGLLDWLVECAKVVVTSHKCAKKCTSPVRRAPDPCKLQNMFVPILSACLLCTWWLCVIFSYAGIESMVGKCPNHLHPPRPAGSPAATSEER